MALAIHEGFGEIGLYGRDFTDPHDRHGGEKGRGCVEFLLGSAAARGIAIHIAGSSTLMDVAAPAAERFYGYGHPVAVARNEAGRYVVAKGGE